MAKKKPATKKAAKRTSKKAAGSTTTKKPASKKTATKKTPTKNAAAKKAAAKKTPSKKTTTKKTPVSKKASASSAAKKTSKKTTSKKPATKEALAGSTTADKATSKKTSKKTPAEKKQDAAAATRTAAAEAKGEAKSNAKADSKSDAKPARKGITIVENRSRKKQAAAKFQPPPSTLGSLLSKRKRQPLIPSGPNAPTSEFSTFGDDADAKARSKKIKSPFKKKELDAFREILLTKRRELAGDVEEMERGMASLGDRGGDPALDVAEQGSDAYDQSLSIGLAEADRKLIREIDEALRRIDDGVYGVCEVTREPISTQRLNELPWTRLSIEAARDAERRGGKR